MLLRGLPIRLVASLHDPSTPIIEQHSGRLKWTGRSALVPGLMMPHRIAHSRCAASMAIPVSRAETCDESRTYAKVFYEAKDTGVDDAYADDLATLGLDIVVGEAGWSRHAPIRCCWSLSSGRTKRPCRLVGF
jgi:hypothetical protein